MNNWKTCKLSEIAEMVMGQSPPGEKCGSEQLGIPLLNGPTEFGSHYPVAVQFTTEPKKISKVHDILFCVRGSTTGRMNWADKEYAIGRGLAAIRHKNGHEFRYFLKGIIDFHLKNILALATGSTFPNIGREQLQDFKILAPGLEVQRLIASILSSFDEKIELNLLMNQTLEAIGQTIFKEWFVNFNFPGSNGEVVDGLPRGWKKIKLSELISVKHGFAFKGEFFKDEETEDILVTPGNFKIGGGFNYSKLKFYEGEIPNDYILNKDDLIVTMTDLSKKGDTLGYPALVPDISGKRLLHNQRIGKVLFNRKDPIKYYLFWAMRQNDYRHFVLGSATGSTVKHTSPSRICDFEMILPDNDILKEFEALASSLIDKEQKNISENSILENLRDTLLPKLMAGKIEVKANA